MGAFTDWFVDEAEAMLPLLAGSLMRAYPPEVAPVESQIRQAWLEVAAGEHGVALLYAFRERLEKVLAPIERRETLRCRVLETLDSLDDDAVGWLLDTGGDAGTAVIAEATTPS